MSYSAGAQIPYYGLADLAVASTLWRPNEIGPTPKTRDDRGLIMAYAMWPVSVNNLKIITSILNRVAEIAPETVLHCQRWIDEIEELDEQWSGKIADGTAHLGNASSYEGPIPGKTLTRDDMKSKADVLEWNTDLQRVKYSTGNPAGTEGAVISQRIEFLKARLLRTLGIDPLNGSCAMLRRS
jgi:hypothetical protein